MKMNARFLHTIGSAALLASATAVWGCPKPETPPVATRPGEAVNVIVQYDPATKAAVMSNKTIYLREGKDWAQWASPDGIVHVSFEKESPFESAPGHDKKVLRSAKPKKGTAGRGFDYTAELVLADGARVRIDPRIEVMR
jgi:hypothetical protein